MITHKFKVGDRVKIKSGTRQNGWDDDGLMKKTIGKIGTIIYSNYSSMTKYIPFQVYFDNKKLNYSNNMEDGWWYNKEDLELVNRVSDKFVEHDGVKVFLLEK